MLHKLEAIGQTHILQEYHCKIAHYQESHKILGVRINHPNIASSTHYLYFVDVFYFEGPFGWTGANFVIPGKQDCYDLWKRLFPDFSDRWIDQLSERFYIWTLPHPHTPVTIAFGDVSVSKDAPVTSR